MAYFGLAGAGLIVGFAAFKYGGVLAGDWNICLLALGALTLVYWIRPAKTVRIPPPDRALLWLVAAVLALASLQIVPLPLSLLRLISPASAGMFEAASAAGGTPAPWASISIVPPATLDHLLRLVAYVLVFLLVRDAACRLGSRSWAAAVPLLVLALLEASLGLVQSYSGGPAGLARGTYPNRNHFAGLLAMALPFAVLAAVAMLRRNRKRFESPAGPAAAACALLVVAAVILLGILHSLSRMGFISTLCSLFVTGAAALGMGHAARKKWLPLAGLLGVVVVLGFVFLPTDQLIARFADLAAGEEISAEGRAQAWRDTGPLIGAYPVFGCGLGAYESAFLRYKTVAPLYAVEFAHNDYLQLLAEFGGLGFALVMLLVFRTLMRAVRAADQMGSGRWLALATVGSLAAILLHSLVDFNLYIPANAAVLAWIAGIVESFPGGWRPEDRIEIWTPNVV
ncbi:MAG: O-antigen ligase family protein [Bryobacterales bacterium]|nr:O-antigen ligase family protein [Bryobacterales bacterium]